MMTDSFTQRTEATQNKIQSFAFVVAAFACVLFSVSFAVSSLSEFGQSCVIELESRINPNNASSPSLVRLPGIGVGRAGAIVAYRANFTEKETHGPAFETIDDLQKVKGIGPKTVQNISKWLKFE